MIAPVADHEGDKEALSTALAYAIKELQKESKGMELPQDTAEGAHEVVIREGRNIQLMCGALELVLRHGLASTWRNGFSSSPSFWAVANRISRKDVATMIKGMTHATTDHSKARAWVRLVRVCYCHCGPRGCTMMLLTGWCARAAERVYCNCACASGLSSVKAQTDMCSWFTTHLSKPKFKAINEQSLESYISVLAQDAGETPAPATTPHAREETFVSESAPPISVLPRLHRACCVLTFAITTP